MLAEMLHCSFSPVEDECLSKTCEVAQLFSTIECTELVIIQDGDYNVVKEMSSGMCYQESVSLPKCKKKEKIKRKKKKVSQTVVKSVVGVLRGCFGKNVRSRPCDF